MVVPSTAAWAIHRAYPVARERTVAADIESMARKMDPMQRMLLQCFLARSLRERVPQAPCSLTAPRLPAPGDEVGYPQNQGQDKKDHEYRQHKERHRALEDNREPATIRAWRQLPHTPMLRAA